MLRMRVLWAGAVIFGLAVLCATWPARPPEAQQPAAVVQIDADDIGGVVTSKNGPEAGVWVIAETGELGTRFAKMVVTDDRGRYVIPDLPQASYSVWVRGYGLVDSPKVKAARGQIVNLTAVLAPSAKAAAEYYPAIYWFSMLKIPDKSVFPGTGSDGNGMPVAFRTQEEWLNAVQLNGCGNCHQLGNFATRWALGPDVSISRVRGQRFTVSGRTVVPTFHPSAALRSGPNGAQMAALQSDIATLARVVAEART